MNLSVLYRGPLTSCNYGCSYCPFAKRAESESQLEKDKLDLRRFVEWIASETTQSWRILFTPWGEALVRAWYRAAIAELTRFEHVELVAAQTNLSCGLDWLRECDVSKLAFWATYHPSEVERVRFVEKVRQVRESGTQLSVGIVGIPTYFPEIAALRESLPSDVPVWINAQQPRPRPYRTDEIDFMQSIDPLFALTSKSQRTFGLSCRTGETSITIDGDGQIRRCHFVDEVIGKITDPNWSACLKRRACPNRSCHCYLGLSHFEPLQLETRYGTNLLVRIPLG